MENKRLNPNCVRAALVAGVALFAGQQAIRGLSEIEQHSQAVELVSSFDRIETQAVEPGDSYDTGLLKVTVPRKGWDIKIDAAQAADVQDKLNNTRNGVEFNYMVDAALPRMSFMGDMSKLGHNVGSGDGQVRTTVAMPLPATGRKRTNDPGFSQNVILKSNEMIGGSFIDRELKIPFNLKWFEGATQHTGLIDRNKNVVVSEFPLSSVYQGLARTVQGYRSLMTHKKPYVVVFSDASWRASQEYGRAAGIYTQGHDFIAMNEAATREDARGYVLDHELKHALYDDLKVRNLNENDLRKITSTYKKYASQDITKNRKYLDSCSKDYMEFFKMFDESEYIKGSDCAPGHPGDSAEELFASAYNVMHLYPREFIRKLNDLADGTLKQDVRSVATALSDIDNTIATKAKKSTGLMKTKLVR